MNISNSEKIKDRLELYSLIMQGLDDVRAGRTYDYKEAMRIAKERAGVIKHEQ